MLLLPLIACRPSDPAPEELDALTRYLFRSVDAEDPEALDRGVQQLELLLVDVDFEANIVERSKTLTSLTEEDVAGITRPDRPLDATYQIGIFHRSVNPLHSHAPYLVWEDQTPINDGSVSYERSFPEEPDPACLPEERCERIYCWNEQRRENAIYKASYELPKIFNWAELEDDRRAVVGRSWFEQSWAADDDAGTLWQSYEVDVWLEQPGGETVRYYASWSENDVSSFDEDVVLGTLRSVTAKRFDLEDQAAAGELP